MNQLTIVVAGLQGSGKDTQVDLLKKYLKEHDPGKRVVHFDPGSMLRKFTATGGYTQEMVETSMNKGELQPLFMLSYMMSEFFISSMQGDEHLFVTGFPRSLDQLIVFNTAMSFYKREKPTLIFLDVPEEVSVERLLKRGRADDTKESIRKRIHWTHEQTLPVIRAFEADPNYTCFEVDGTPSIEEIHKDIMQKLNLQ